ncbi:hypothetical protein [Sulfuricurvum sp.]|uniref:hypothetical protein n=1 Tax=Sulfuricurvum sp. TaxID=2025608 RepID=UPI002628958E|nr:hypothetical protein [Sulfuricurvum sp.]MDD4949640.1 hypothetical protein [Sulfuricurvum sp.]
MAFNSSVTSPWMERMLKQMQKDYNTFTPPRSMLDYISEPKYGWENLRLKNSPYSSIDSLTKPTVLKTAEQLKAEADYSKIINEKWLKGSDGSIVDTSLDFIGGKTGAILTGALVGGTYLTNKATQIQNQLDSTHKSVSTTVDNLTKNLLSPTTPFEPHFNYPASTAPQYQPQAFIYNPDNSPPLVSGIMNSSVMIAKAIDGLSTTLKESFDLQNGLALQNMTNSYEQNERSIASILAIANFVNDIANNLNEYTTLDGLQKVADSIAQSQPIVNNQQNVNLDVTPVGYAIDNQTKSLESQTKTFEQKWNEIIAVQKQVNDTIGNTLNYAPLTEAINTQTAFHADVATAIREQTTSHGTHLENLSNWASTAHENELFKQAPQTHLDSEGFALAPEMSPQQLQAYNNAQNVKLTDDKNTIKIEDDDFRPLPDPSSFFPFIPFVGRDYVFNPDTEIDGIDHNVFMPLNMGANQ